MRTSTWRRRASEALTVAGLGLAAAPAQADFRDAYRRGVEAAAQQRWPEAERFMRAAIAEHPREGETVALEGRTEPYLPRFYLGLALFNQADCLAARREWEAARKQGALQRSAAYRTVEKLNQECQKRLPREAAAARSGRAVDDDLRKAEALASAVAGLGSSTSLSADEQQALDKGVREARERLAEAHAKLDAGRRDADLGDIAKARELAQRAIDGLEKSRRRAMRDYVAPVATREPASPTPGPGPPGELLVAARAYFDGRYDETVAALQDVRYADPGAALQAHLLRAAARHALYVLGGRRDPALHAAAVADVEAVRRLDPGFEPDAALFSPRFRELFRKKG